MIQFKGAFFYKLNHQSGKFSFPWNVTTRIVSHHDLPVQLVGFGHKIKITAQNVQHNVAHWSPEHEWIATSQHPLQKIELNRLQINSQINIPMKLKELNSIQIQIPLKQQDLSVFQNFQIPQIICEIPK
jgi:hypothetical protein